MPRRRTRAAALLLLPTLASCAGNPPVQRHGADRPSAEPPWLDEQAVLLQLVDEQLYEPVLTERFLEGPPALREALAVALGRIGDPRGGTALELLLRDEAVEVRRAAAFALGLLGEPAAVDALLRAASRPDEETGRLAVEALARCGAELDAVEEALGSLSDREEAERRLLPSLFRFQGTGVVERARAGLEDTQPTIHRWAAYALTRVPQEEALPAIRRLIDDPEPEIRAWAARALGLIGDADDLERLHPLLDDEAPGPSIQALRAAAALVESGRAAAPAAWVPDLERFLAERRPGVRLTAIEAAGAWLLHPVLGAELAALAADGDGRERQLALLALARGEDPRAPTLVERAAAAPDPVLRATAAEAAAALRDTTLLARLAADPEPGVRVAAIPALLGLAAVDGGEIADEALRDPDPYVRTAALEWLVESPVVPVAGIEGALAATASPVPDPAIAAAAAVAARAETAAGERGEAVALLNRLARGRDLLVRRAAGRALETLGEPAPRPGPTGTGRDLQTYREIVQRTDTPRRVELQTERGLLVVELDCPRAPLTCINFLNLASQGYLDGLTFHRVVPDFVVQGGDPLGTGWGGPGYAIRDELNRIRYERGVVGMALAGPDTGGSQFFITLAAQPHLDGGYTAFGRVVGGAGVLDRIVQGDRILAVHPLP